MENLIDIADLERTEIEDLYELTDELKDAPGEYSSALQQKTLLMLFAKPSTRTRISFEAGMTQLGGHGIYFYTERSQMSRGESLKDTAKVVSRYADGVMARLYEHQQLQEIAGYADIPVVNGLTDRLHPCQALADLYTVQEKGLSLEDTEVVFVGDGNNVAQSLIQACVALGADVTWSGPQGYEPDKDMIEAARERGEETGASVRIVHDPHHAVEGADVLYTDVFVSMGDEDAEGKRERLHAYQVDQNLVEEAGDPFVMHPLPAHRGEEVTAEVLDGTNAIVYDQAENRLHLQKAVLIELLG